MIPQVAARRGLSYPRAGGRRNPAGIPPEPEEQFQQSVIELARRLGWRAYHARDARRSTAGLPDLLLVHVGRRQVIWAELKRESGQVSAAQHEWIEALRACGQAVYVWRPSDTAKIARILVGATG